MSYFSCTTYLYENKYIKGLLQIGGHPRSVRESVKGGIIIPDSAKEKQQEGEVIAVGAGKREKGERVPLDVKPGDRVLFGKYSGTEIKIEDEELLILREEEILAKLSGAAKAAGKK